MAFMRELLFVTLFGVALSLPTSFNSADVCNSAECQDVAKLIKENLDENADPCEDFYAFACGGFKNVFPIPEGAQNIDGFVLARRQLNGKLVGLLDDPKLKNHGSKVVRIAKQMYDDCMNGDRENTTTQLTARVFSNQGISLVPEGMYKSQSLKHTPEEICREKVYYKYSFVVVRLYVDKYFPITEYKSSRDMVINVWKAFRSDIIKQVPWMNHETHKSVIENLDNLTISTGYPDWLTDDRELDKQYEGRAHTNWRVDPFTVNAYFYQLPPEIIIPAGILQAQIFKNKFPKYINYGAAGNIVGHEISHGVDSWTRANKDGRKRAHECIVNQSKTIREPQTGQAYKNESPFYTGSQIIADIGGINASYSAYKSAVRGQEQQLPGLTKYSTDQIFFLAQANVWCANSRDEYIRNSMSYSIHVLPYNYYRVVIPAVNSPVFAKVYNCKAGTRMNPTDKCRIW